MVQTQKLSPGCRACTLDQMSGHPGHEEKEGRTLWLRGRLCECPGGTLQVPWLAFTGNLLLLLFAKGDICNLCSVKSHLYQSFIWKGCSLVISSSQSILSHWVIRRIFCNKRGWEETGYFSQMFTQHSKPILKPKASTFSLLSTHVQVG